MFEVATYLGASISLGLAFGVLYALLAKPGVGALKVAVSFWIVSFVALSLLHSFVIPAWLSWISWTFLAIIGFGVGAILGEIVRSILELQAIVKSAQKEQK